MVPSQWIPMQLSTPLWLMQTPNHELALGCWKRVRNARSSSPRYGCGDEEFRLALAIPFTCLFSLSLSRDHFHITFYMIFLHTYSCRFHPIVFECHPTTKSWDSFKLSTTTVYHVQTCAWHTTPINQQNAFGGGITEPVRTVQYCTWFIQEFPKENALFPLSQYCTIVRGSYVLILTLLDTLAS